MKTAYQSQTITLTRRPRPVASLPDGGAEITDPGAPIDAVCDLLAAAGPLTVENIAGGLNVAVQRVSVHVRWMLSRGLLRQDEFERYRACGACAR